MLILIYIYLIHVVIIYTLKNYCTTVQFTDFGFYFSADCHQGAKMAGDWQIKENQKGGALSLNSRGY